MLSADMLAIAIQINQTTMIQGLPGIGKTAITKEIVAQIGERRHPGEAFPLVFQSLAQIRPEDLAGAQVPNHETRTMDAYAMGTIKPLIQAGKGVYFGDEYASCMGGTRAAFLNAAQDRLFGDAHLPDVAVVCAMNPPDMATDGQDMTLPESNRFFWLEWGLDNGAWFDWMLGGQGAAARFPIVPKNWEKTHLPKARSLIVTYLRQTPSEVHTMPPAEQATQAWASHRSWFNAARMLAAVLASGYSQASDHVHAAIKGCVGGTAADRFFAWVADMDLPDPEHLLGDPQNAHKLLPKRHDRVMACLESVAAAAVEDRPNKNERWNAAWEIMLPVVRTHQDRVVQAAAILAAHKPKGVAYPKEIAEIREFKRAAGLTAARPV